MTNPWRIALLLSGVTALAWLFAGRGPVGHTSHAACFAHADCPKDQSCVVSPKGDGFATMGICGEPCESDEGCPNGWRCTRLLASGQVLVPVGTSGATGEARRVCSPAGGQ